MPKQCNFISYKKYDPILIFRKDHPLAQKKEVILEDVVEYDLIKIDSHLVAMPLFDETVRNFNIKSNFKFENGDWETLIRMVKSNCGIAVVSMLNLSEYDKKDLEYRSLTRYF